MDLANQIT